MSPQLPLDLSHNAARSREDLIDSKANATAIAMIDAWPNWPSHVAILAGPVGSGKTHLASIWSEAAGGRLLGIEEFSQNSGELINEVTSGQNLVIEDLGEQPFDETALFHLLNAVRESGSYCLLTSRTWPREWPIELADLKSRLLAAQLVELQEPDDELLKKVIAKLFADRQLAVDAQIVEYCVVRMERSLETAAKLVAEMDAIALAKKSVISRSVAAEALRTLEVR